MGKPKNMTHTIITFQCPSMQKIPQLPNSVAPFQSAAGQSAHGRNSGEEEHQTISLKLPFSQTHRLPFFAVVVVVVVIVVIFCAAMQSDSEVLHHGERSGVTRLQSKVKTIWIWHCHLVNTLTQTASQGCSVCVTVYLLCHPHHLLHIHTFWETKLLTLAAWVQQIPHKMLSKSLFKNVSR